MTTLFAALSIPDETVIGQCQDRHRHQEWLKFLKLMPYIWKAQANDILAKVTRAPAKLNRRKRNTH